MEVLVIKYTAMFLAFLIAIIGHEIMHGLVAKYYKDDTAQKEGRLSINPIKHIDIVGSIIFPISLYLIQKLSNVENPIIFGWAKPVPVNIFKVVENGGYLAAFNVSIAGITYNILLAILASTFLYYALPLNSIFNIFLFEFLLYLVIINVVLFVFNLLPIPTLDGANAIKYLSLQFKLYKVAEVINKLEPYGIIMLMIILFTPLSSVIYYPMNFILSLLIHG